MSSQKQATFKIWRGNATGGEFREYTTGVSDGMVVLGRDQRYAEVDVHDSAERSASCKTGDSSANKGLSADKGFANKCLLEFSSEEKN